MTNKHTHLKASNSEGQHVQLSHTTTDSPILPVADLQQLQQFNPELVQWVVRQTEIEAEHRRKESHRVNLYVFIERISSVLVGAIVALGGLSVAAYVAMNGHDWVAVGIGGATLAAIVTALAVKRDPNRASHTSPPQKKGRPKK